MTWLDVAFIVLLVVFLAVGAKLGSLWTGACLMGGFFGGFMVDYYMLPVSGMIGNFPGAEKIAGVLLFLAGVGAALVPGWVLSRLSSGLVLGVVDSIFGFVTGALACLIAVSLAFLYLVPMAPRLEKSKAWQNSLLVRPLQRFVEDIFSDSRFQGGSPLKDLKDDFVKDFSPAVKKAEKTVISAGQGLVEKIRKKK